MIRHWIAPPAVYMLLTTCLLSARAADVARDPVKPLPYGREELLSPKVRDTYEGEHLNEVAFPLGGIGSGCISLSGRGGLINWEIFNRPNIGHRPPFTFLSLWAKPKDAQPVFRVLEGRLAPPYMGRGAADWKGYGFGPRYESAAGLPRMEHARFKGRFPLATVELKDRKVPLAVTIEGWSPFIPGNDRDSSLPVAILNVTLRNPTRQPVKAHLAMNMANVCGQKAVNEIVRSPGFYALVMHTPADSASGSVVVATPQPITMWHPRWDRSGWEGRGGLTHFVETFARKGMLDRRPDPDAEGVVDTAPAGVASIGMEVNLPPGGSHTTVLVIAWHFPRRPENVTNYYATQWRDATEVARYTLANLKRLEADTRLFQETFFGSSLPGVVLEAVSSQLCVLRTPTVFRMDDGTLYGYEGCHARAGCCQGTCTHVWHYAQSLAYLFPALERQMREMDYKYRLRPSDGHMQFRIHPPYHQKPKKWFGAAADGQFGTVLRVCREWQISGNDAWLKELWPKVKKSLEYAWVAWDKNRDGLLDEPRHCTLDLDLCGHETFCGSLYLAALLAGERMAGRVGDRAAAAEYRRVFESGRKRTDAELFNGEYYVQKLPPQHDGNTQYAGGCISEQLIGQWYARMLDLGDVYSPQHVRKAVASVFRHNFLSDCSEHLNCSCVFNLNDDAGVLICTWPHGGRPRQPLFYADTFMVGYEDQVAAHLVYEGFLLEGLSVTKAVRDRHDGRKRNPYNQIQCGSYYARSMANYGSLLALSGLHYRGAEKMLKLAPRVSVDDFRVFFSVDSGWGTVSQKIASELHAGRQEVSVKPVRGKLGVAVLTLHAARPVRSAGARLGRRPIDVTMSTAGDMVRVELAQPVDALADKPLTVELRF